MIQIVRRRLLVALTVWFGAAVFGCARAPTAPTVVRRVDGRRVTGPFVPASAYEAYVRGELLLQSGHADRAIGRFQLALAAPEEDPYVLAQLAKAYALAGDLPRSEAALARAAKLDPCSEPVWLVRAELATRSDDAHRASEAYEQAMLCAPASPLGLQGLARLHRERGSAHEALSSALVLCRLDGQPQTLRAFLRALDSAEPAEVTFALERWAREDTVDRSVVLAAIEHALDQDQLTLALRLKDHAAFRLPPELAARIAHRAGADEELLALLSLHDGGRLGGHAKAARYALDAGDLARASLEASLARKEPNMGVLTARSAALGGRLGEANAAIGALDRKSAVLAALPDALAESGQPELARELSALSKEGSVLSE